MFQTLSRIGLLSPAGARWRSYGGLGVMLLAIAQTARAVDDWSRLAASALTTVLMSIGWLLTTDRQQATPRLIAGVWLLGGGSVVLMMLLPGAGPVIGVIAAIVTNGLRLPARAGLVVSVVLGVAYVAVDGATTGLGSPVTLALNALGLTFAYVAATSVRRIRDERERAEALLVELQRTRDAQIEAAALGERARIAREIHDVLAHTLSALAVQLEGTRMLLEQRPNDPAALAAIARAGRLAREGLDETRRAVGALRGDRLPGPDGLVSLVEEFGEECGIPSRFQVEGQPVPLASDAQLALYRTAQEALTNVRKHAQATSVDVQLRYTADGAELVVEDVAPPRVPRLNGQSGVGYGLVGMRERAELLGGALDAGPSPTGFRVRLWLPKT